LSTSGSERGIDVQSTGDLVVNGEVFSNSRIRVANNADLVVHGGRAWARGSCSGSIDLDPETIAGNCNLGSSGSPAIANDPNYVPFVNSVPSNGSGSCSAGNATLFPGRFTFSSWQTAVGNCARIHLRPGVF
jgi:hypothetical protein